MESVTAIIVTRGDVDLSEILYSLPAEWEKIEWNNGAEAIYWHPPPNKYLNAYDAAVYGRYAAIEHASNDLIYVQDDDCVVSDPQAIVDAWWERWHFADNSDGRSGPPGPSGVVCNMPAAFRARHFYDEHSLVGFGACFHRDAPQRAFARFFGSDTGHLITRDLLLFHRTCDIVFTGLTPRVLVDVPYDDLPWASAENRMWKQADHVETRTKMLELVLKVRDV